MMLKDVVQETPVVDGSGLKNTLEKLVIKTLDKDPRFKFRDKKTLMVCAMDRFGMASALVEAGADIIFGDMI